VDPDGNEFDFDLKTEEGRQFLFAFTDCALACSDQNRENMYSLQESPSVFHIGTVPADLFSRAGGGYNPSLQSFFWKPGKLNAETFSHELTHAYNHKILGMSGGVMSEEVNAYKHGFLEVNRLKSGQRVSQPGAYDLWSKGKSDKVVGNQLWWSGYKDAPGYTNDLDP
jgi:hypothetical protein